MAAAPTLRKEDLLMVEWLVEKYASAYEFLSTYLFQLQQIVNAILENQYILWILVVLFILVLRWLTQPRSDMM